MNRKIPIRTIHQFHSGSALGDAVTNGMYFTRKLLREMGFHSNIYVQHRAPELEAELLPWTRLEPSPDQLLLVHHSMGHDLGDWVCSLPVSKCLVYHNITPSSFFQKGDPLRHYSEIGRDLLARYAPHMLCALADSEFNADELRRLGYSRVQVLPLLFDEESFRATQPNRQLMETLSSRYTVLFVGRISPNKRQDELVELFARFRAYRPDAHLTLVGGYSPGEPFVSEVRKRIVDLGLEQYVSLPGKVTSEALAAYYRGASIFVSLSEHEGFGVPLIEAMHSDLPVVAWDSAAVRETLDGAGVLVTEKDLDKLAAFLSLLSNNRRLRSRILRGQRSRIASFSRAAIVNDLQKWLSDIGIPVLRSPEPGAGAQCDYRIEGPFDSSYSLALVNRELARALEKAKPGNVALFSTEGPGDFAPSEEFLSASPDIGDLWRRADDSSTPDLCLRNLFPPRVTGMTGRHRALGCWGWEESLVPEDFVEAMNRHLDFVTVLSPFVQKALIDSGIRIPVFVAGAGADHIKRLQENPAPIASKKSFRFLHISSAFPRKGVDVLLRSYSKAFTDADDVVLILKVFPNPHNTVRELLDALRRTTPDCPEIELIEADLAPEQIKSLLVNSHCLVMPSRGEGFGLPAAEAMLLDIPVIAAPVGGLASFCSEATCWPVAYTYSPAQSHFAQPDSLWADPDEESLAAQLRSVRMASAEEKKKKTQAARETVESFWTWDHVARRVVEASQCYEKLPVVSEPLRIGWLSTWNSSCGIAMYSRNLTEKIRRHYSFTVLAKDDEELLDKDEPFVRRCWNLAEQGSVTENIVAECCNCLVIQYNFAFFHPADLARLIYKAKKASLTVVVELHATSDVNIPNFQRSLRDAADALAAADRLLVHSVEDVNRLHTIGLESNVTLFPLGVHVPGKLRDTEKSEETGSPIIATFGFLLPPKGVLELIEAFSLLRARYPNAKLHLWTSRFGARKESADYEKICRARISALRLEPHVLMETSFLSETNISERLQNASLIVFPYQYSGESASAAVRFGLSSLRPVLCTPLAVFSDIMNVVHFSNSTSPQSIAEGINDILSDAEIRRKLIESQKTWIQAHTWPQMGGRLQRLLEALRTQNLLRRNAPRA